PVTSGPGAEAPAADLPAEARPLLASPGTPGRVRTGLDVVAAQNFAMFSGHSIGLITNQTGVDAQGRRAIDLLADAPGVRLQVIFSPEHGIGGDATTDVPHGRDPATGRPIWSLYGGARRDSPRRARPSEPDHGERRRGTADGPRPPVLHRSPHDPRPGRTDHR